MAAVCGVHDPGGAVDVEADMLRRGGKRLAGMHGCRVASGETTDTPNPRRHAASQQRHS
jgi:hypothetical protein